MWYQKKGCGDRKEDVVSLKVVLGRYQYQSVKPVTNILKAAVLA